MRNMQLKIYKHKKKYLLAISSIILISSHASAMITDQYIKIDRANLSIYGASKIYRYIDKEVKPGMIWSAPSIEKLKDLFKNSTVNVDKHLSSNKENLDALLQDNEVRYISSVILPRLEEEALRQQKENLEYIKNPNSREATNHNRRFIKKLLRGVAYNFNSRRNNTLKQLDSYTRKGIRSDALWQKATKKLEAMRVQGRTIKAMDLSILSHKGEVPKKLSKPAKDPCLLKQKSDVSLTARREGVYDHDDVREFVIQACNYYASKTGNASPPDQEGDNKSPKQTRETIIHSIKEDVSNRIATLSAMTDDQLKEKLELGDMPEQQQKEYIYQYRQNLKNLPYYDYVIDEAIEIELDNYTKENEQLTKPETIEDKAKAINAELENIFSTLQKDDDHNLLPSEVKKLIDSASLEDKEKLKNNIADSGKNSTENTDTVDGISEELAEAIAQRTTRRIVNFFKPVVDNMGIVAAGEEESHNRFGIWSSFFIGRGKDNSTKNKYKTSSYGGGLGMDYEIADDIILGISGRISKGKSNSLNTKSKSNIESYLISLYTAGKKGKIMWESSIFGGKSNINTTIEKPNRKKSIAKAKNHSITYGTETRIGYDVSMNDKLSIIPTVGFRYAHFDNSKAKEKGAGIFNNEIAANTLDRIVLIAGGRLVSTIEVSESCTISPEIYGFARYRLQDESSGIKVTMTATQQEIEYSSKNSTKFRFNTGVALNAVNGVFSYGVNLNLHKAKSYHALTGTVKLKVDL